MNGAEEERGSATAGSGDPAAGGHVRALDGTRAVAVVLVLLFHLRFPGFKAGFLGVDIFFVLSGFLITTLLLTEVSRTGRVSLPEFWARRARRLLPALVVLLIAVAAVTWLNSTFTERGSVRGDLLATTGYVANWHLINTSSYFADIGVDSPLEHTWSLAIEEQFYVFWPLVVFGVASLWRRTRVGVGVIAVAGSVISAGLLWLLWSPGSVERAYMGTDARIFEPLIGAAGAALVATPSVRRWLDRRGDAVLGLGVLGLAAGILLIAANPSSYYLGGALLVALATLMIVGPLWIGRGGTLSRVLGWSPIAWIGVVSYGAYLWHWPLILWLGARQAEGSGLLVRRLGVIALTLGVAGLSYHAIEHPIRRGRIWSRAMAGSRTRGKVLQRRVTLAAIPVSLLTVASISVAATRVPDIPSSVPSMMMVGDSVPLHLAVSMDQALRERGWRLVSATHGACPVTGEAPARPDGTAVAKADRCSAQIVREQDQIVRETDPEIVLWWDRWSVSDFLTADGEYVRSGSVRFWDLRSESLDRAVERLASAGAKVVLVATEPPGEGIERARCTDTHCHRWVRFQLDHYGDITRRWNTILHRYAERHPDLARFVSVTDVICRADVAPCDDRIDGIRARPDGTHYECEGESLVIDTLLRLLAPVMEPFSRPAG